MVFIFSTPVLIRHTWQLNIVVSTDSDEEAQKFYNIVISGLLMMRHLALYHAFGEMGRKGKGQKRAETTESQVTMLQNFFP
jgi:hypothetical protein